MLVPAQVFEAANAASKDKERRALRLLHVERGEDGTPQVVASDGSSIVAAAWIEKDSGAWPESAEGASGTVEMFSTNISRDLALRAAKSAPGHEELPIGDTWLLDEQQGTDNGQSVLHACDLVHAQKLVEQQNEIAFGLDWEAALPDMTGRDAVRLLVNPGKLARLLDAVSKTAAYASFACITISKKDKPISITTYDKVTGVAVRAALMPLRDEGGATMKLCEDPIATLRREREAQAGNSGKD